MSILVEYNKRGLGPIVHNQIEEDLLIFYNHIVNGKKYVAYTLDLQGGWYRQANRQWFCNWNIEAFKWNKGKLIKVAEDNFHPYKKRIHFHLDEEATIEEHKQYILACIEFITLWEIDSYTIETYYADQLKSEFPTLFLSEFILDDNCYANYVIKRTPSAYSSYENFGVPSLKEEFLYFNFDHPCNPDNQTSYEFAKSILFGPDYKNLLSFFPYEWTLKEPIVY